MRSSRGRARPRVRDVRVDRERLTVDLEDGRSLSAPLSWFPRLSKGTPAQWSKWETCSGGSGIHWPDLDEDISVASLLAGRSSGESQASLERWLKGRK